MNNIFISYAREDARLMRSARDALSKAGLVVWTDAGLEPGTPAWEEALAKAIKAAQCVVVLLSPEAEQSSWVNRELAYAENAGKRIFPVLVRGTEQDAVPLRLSSTQYIDGRLDFEAATRQLVEAATAHIGRLPTSIPGDRTDAPRQPRSKMPLLLGAGAVTLTAVSVVVGVLALRALNNTGNGSSNLVYEETHDYPGYAPPQTASIHDSFGDPSLNNTFNSDRWLLMSELGCNATQLNGNLEVDGEGTCYFVMLPDREVSIMHTGTIETQMAIPDWHLHSYEATSAQMVIWTDDLSEAGWHASCGLDADESGIDAYMLVHNEANGETPEFYNAVTVEANRWYTFRLTIDPDTLEISCWGDATLLGSVVPEDADALREATFERQLAVTGVMYVSYVGLDP